MNKNTLGRLLLRIGLSSVFLWFGIDKFVHPDIWVNYIPSWFPMLIPVSTFILLMGIVESLVGFFVLIGFYTRTCASLAALMMIPIIISLGYNEIGVRDFGILLLAIGIAVLGAGEFSMDAQLLKTREHVNENW